MGWRPAGQGRGGGSPGPDCPDRGPVPPPGLPLRRNHHRRLGLLGQGLRATPGPPVEDEVGASAVGVRHPDLGGDGLGDLLARHHGDRSSDRPWERLHHPLPGLRGLGHLPLRLSCHRVRRGGRRGQPEVSMGEGPELFGHGEGEEEQLRGLSRTRPGGTGAVCHRLSPRDPRRGLLPGAYANLVALLPGGLHVDPQAHLSRGGRPSNDPEVHEGQPWSRGPAGRHGVPDRGQRLQTSPEDGVHNRLGCQQGRVHPHGEHRSRQPGAGAGGHPQGALR